MEKTEDYLAINLTRLAREAEKYEQSLRKKKGCVSGFIMSRLSGLLAAS